MAKSVRFKDNTFLNSDSVIHNQELLSSLLDIMSKTKRVGTLDYNSNLDKVTTPGLYDLFGAKHPTDNSSQIWGTLLVFGDHYKFQILIGNYSVYNILVCIRAASEQADFTNCPWAWIPGNFNSNTQTNIDRKQVRVLWEGSIATSSIGVSNSVAVSDSVYNYDFLLVEVSAGNSASERICLTLPTGRYSVTTYVSGYLFLIGGYNASVIVNANGYSAVGFLVKEVHGWNVSDIKLNRVTGVKLST